MLLLPPITTEPYPEATEKVPPPTIKLRPNVQVVRDMPLVKDLEPIEIPAAPVAKEKAKAAPNTTLKCFGEAATSKWGLILVLGLLFIIVRSYNKA